MITPPPPPRPPLHDPVPPPPLVRVHILCEEICPYRSSIRRFSSTEIHFTFHIQSLLGGAGFSLTEKEKKRNLLNWCWSPAKLIKDLQFPPSSMMTKGCDFWMSLPGCGSDSLSVWVCVCVCCIPKGSLRSRTQRDNLWPIMRKFSLIKFSVLCVSAVLIGWEFESIPYSGIEDGRLMSWQGSGGGKEEKEKRGQTVCSQSWVVMNTNHSFFMFPLWI